MIEYDFAFINGHKPLGLVVQYPTVDHLEIIHTPKGLNCSAQNPLAKMKFLLV